jgi:WXG100 family type VII secretion target
MSQDVIQANYEQLREVARRFQAQAESCAELRKTIDHAFDSLHSGGWIGKGSQAFFSEMNSDLLPALDRLHNAMTQGEAVVQEAIKILRAAEEEAGRLFQATATTSAETTPSDNGNKTEPASGKKEGDLFVRPPNELFKDGEMSKMLGKTWAGEGDPRLAWAMTVLRKNPSDSDRDKALDIIADLRGLKRSEVDQQYAKFCDLQAKAQSKAEKSKQPIQELMPVTRSPEELAKMLVDPAAFAKGVLATELGKTQLNYTGSRDHLRFGQVVGDAFGIDPVFGAMLNPTGGMPGSGEWAIPTGESALSYHAAFHDAAGFLHTYFGGGPGYDYLDAELGSTDEPFTGHESGLIYWNQKFLTSEFLHGRLDKNDINSAIVTVGGGAILSTISSVQTGWDWFTKTIQGK